MGLFLTKMTMHCQVQWTRYTQKIDYIQMTPFSIPLNLILLSKIISNERAEFSIFI